MAFGEYLGFVFNPLLSLGAFWALLIVSFIVSLIVTLIYKFFSNQDEMKRLKGEMKEEQKRMKEMKSEPEKMLEMQKKVMSKNMEYMKHSFKPMLITFIPVILIFAWLQAALAFEAINVGDEFNVDVIFNEGVDGNLSATIKDEGIKIIGEDTKEISQINNFKFKAVEKGEYFIDFEYDDRVCSRKVIVDEVKYAGQVEKCKKVEEIKGMRINYSGLKPLGEFSIFGWHPGWLGLYIILSLVFSLTLRKVLKLH